MYGHNWGREHTSMEAINMTVLCNQSIISAWERGHKSGIVDAVVFLSATTLVCTAFWMLLWFRNAPPIVGTRPDVPPPHSCKMHNHGLHINEPRPARPSEKTPVLHACHTPKDTSI